MKFERKLYDMNSILALPLSKDLAEYLGLDKDSTVIIEPKEKGKGRYFAIWNKKDDKE